MGKETNKVFGLLGRNISYSFSKNYFTEKFKKLQLPNYQYLNFDIQDIKEFPEILNANPGLIGFNVTIPYKTAIIPFLDELDDTAREIGAVNTVRILKNGKLKGYNTDCYGFEHSIKPLLKKYHTKSLLLGTGGASKAIQYVLEKLHIEVTFVSRTPNGSNQIKYQDLNEEFIKENLIIVNCTPLGTFPNVANAPDIPYPFLTSNHLLYDLIYNPSETAFLKNGSLKGAITKNGLEMLELQAEKAWMIWQN